MLNGESQDLGPSKNPSERQKKTRFFLPHIWKSRKNGETLVVEANKSSSFIPFPSLLIPCALRPQPVKSKIKAFNFLQQEFSC